MKKNYLLLLLPLLFAACQPKTETTSTTAEATPNYPYQIKHPDNWITDTSHTNTMVALTALKSYEKMDTATMKKCFADTMEFNYSGGKFKGTNAEFVKMVTESKDTYVKIDMKDWEAVVGKDAAKEEWVTLWYTQHWTNAKGIADSIQYIDDVMLKNGKIVKLNEYGLRFPKK